MKVENAVIPTSEQAAAFFGGTEDGPFVMVNLLKFRDKADYPDGRDADISGAAAYARYGAAVGACLASVGARAIYAGPVTGILLGEVEELWDMVALAEYPSLAAMQSMISSDAYRAIAFHRIAGLKGQLNIKTRPAR